MSAITMVFLVACMGHDDFEVRELAYEACDFLCDHTRRRTWDVPYRILRHTRFAWELPLWLDRHPDQEVRSRLLRLARKYEDDWVTGRWILYKDGIYRGDASFANHGGHFNTHAGRFYDEFLYEVTAHGVACKVTTHGDRGNWGRTETYGVTRKPLNGWTLEQLGGPLRLGLVRQDWWPWPPPPAHK